MKNNISLFALLSFLMISYSAVSQEYLLDEKVSVDSTKTSYGKNAKHFLYVYHSLGFAFNAPNESSDVYIGKSTSYNVGFGYKRKLINAVHIGSEFAFGFDSYRINKPSPPINNAESYKYLYKVNYLKASPYLRFNFFNKGNHIAFFLDLRAYANYNYLGSQVEKYETKSPLTGEITNNKNINESKDFVNNVNYGLGIRFGYGKFAIFGDYAIERIQPNVVGNYQIAPLTIGLQIGMY
jgi:hypothetical protein